MGKGLGKAAGKSIFHPMGPSRESRCHPHPDPAPPLLLRKNMIATPPPGPRPRFLMVLCALGMVTGLNSCTTTDEERAEAARERQEAKIEKQEMKERLAARNELYSNLQDRRRLRKQAREDRYQAWWDRVMH